MAVSALTGVMDSLVSKLSDLLTHQYKQRKGLRGDIQFLRHELVHMNAAMLKLAGRENLDPQTKAWRDQVREMAYDIEDHIDIFMHKVCQGDDDKDGLFHKIARKSKELLEHYQFASKIQELRARVEEQSQSRDRYKIDESASESRMVRVDPRLPALFEDAKRLVGIDGPRDEIIKKMVVEEGATDSEKLLKVVSIVGFGGLGKTTLANQVYTKIKSDFECTAFVSVSRTPHMPKILNDILSGVGYGGGTEMEDDAHKLIGILRAHLTNKRYLVIIDDLWSIEDWRIIKCAFVENNNGSTVITTTRNLDVAKSCCFSSQDIYYMKPLDEHHSRRLFFKRLFDTEDGCPEIFREISDSMLRKCKGVPLAITSIASLLAHQSERFDTWVKIHNSLGSELDTNPTLAWMRFVLSLSYNDLSCELKTCLLYIGMYPEDHQITKNDLVRKWIAEGIVSEKCGLDLEEAAENCFNELINRSMIQPLFYNSLFPSCQVHDLMLDLIISKCKEENFITIIDGNLKKNGALQVRRISHQLDNSDTAVAIEEMSKSHVRTYKSFPAAQCVPSLSKFELLRILDMESDMITRYPRLDLSAINHLFLLRYLKVRGFDLELPKKFGKLKHLMTLDMSGAGLFPSKQSSDLTSLSSLRHLEFPEVGGTVALTNGLSKLRNLRTLSKLHITANSAECIRDLGELTNLRELVLNGFDSGLRGAEDNLDTILAASLDKLGNSNLRGLYMYYDPVAATPATEFWNSFFTRPRHLQELLFWFDFIPKVPTWMAHTERLSYLRDLRVQELRNDDFQVLAQLPCLIFLSLEAKAIPEKNIIVYPDTFPKLEYFAFCYELSCLTFEPAAMPRLQRLDIGFNIGGQYSAMQLQEGIPVGGVEHLASLEKIDVDFGAKCGLGSKIESAWRDAISKHPRSQDMQICIVYTEYVEIGSVALANRETAL